MGGSRCDRHARLGKSSKRVSDPVHTCAGAHACPCAVTPLRTQSGLLWICANVRFNWKPPDPSAVAGPWGTQQRGRGESAHHSGLSRAWRLRPPLNGFTSERPFVPPRSGFESLRKTANNLARRSHSGSSNVLHPTEIKAGSVGHSLCNKSTWVELLTRKGLVLHARGPGHTHVLQFCKMSLGRRSHFLLFPILAHFSKLTTYDSPKDQISSC